MGERPGGLPEGDGLMGYRTERRPLPRFVVVEVWCDNCDKRLKQVFEYETETVQPEDALEIVLVGYYGGYFDTSAGWVPGSEHPTVHFCGECADKLCEAFPSIRKAIQDSNP